MRNENRKRLKSQGRTTNRRRGRRLFLESLETRIVLTGMHDLVETTDQLPDEPSSSVADVAQNVVAEGEHTAESAAEHIHAHLTIFVDGTQVVIPTNIGVSATGPLSQIHTEDASGELHIQPIAAELRDRTLTLGDFFDTWRTNAGLAGNNANATLSPTQLFNNVADTTDTVTMFVNGQISTEFDEHLLHDDDDIILVFGSDPVVSLNTNFGSIVIELFETETPGTVNNFLNYVNDGDYINSFFHRSADSAGADFVIQGGGFRTPSTTFTSTAQFSSVPTDPPIQNEPGISNLRGTVAMAKTSNPDSATSQFFVNLNDANTFLDSPTNSGGFTVFGQVLDLRTSDEIAALPTRSNPSPYGELPVSTDNQLVVIQSIAGQGEISGTHFNDTNRNGTRDSGESAIAGATIYIDANNNGVLDPGELSTATDANGRYLFQLDPGAYTVRAQIDSALSLTVPTSADSYSVTVQIGREVVNRNFGVAENNDTPITQADTYSVNEDAVLTVVVANGVLVNDMSQTSAALTASVNTQPAHGAVTLNANGSFTYTPTANFFGTDTFTYIASDGTNQSSATAVTVTVNAQPDAPVAVADSLTFSNSRTPRTIDVLANDTSAPDAAQTLTVTSTTQGTAGGTVSLANGVVSYLAPAGFVGTDTFTYTIRDTDGLTNSATATINVTEVANNSLSGFVYLDADSNGLRETGEVGVPGAQVTLTGNGVSQTVLTNSSGSYSFVELPAGTYQLVERQPTALLDGTDSTTVSNAVVSNDRITTITLDGGQDVAENNFGEAGIHSQYVSIAWFFASSSSSEAMFRETIAMGEELAGDMALAATIRAGGTEVPDGTNSAPIANGNTFAVNENSVLTVTAASGVLNNDTDIDGDSLTAVVLTQPAHGTLNFNGNGSFTYTPSANFFGSDSFTYQASDGTKLSNTATVTITVNAVGGTNTFSLNENSAAGTVVGTLSPEGELGSNVVFEVENSSINPLLELAADDHFEGDPAASVVLIEYMDLSCPHCRDIHSVVEQLETDFAGELLVVRRHLLLFNASTNSFVFPNSLAAARAAEAAARQGMFDEMVDLLFANQNEWRAVTNPSTFFNQYAQQIGLNLTQFTSDQADPAINARIQRDRDAAATLGLTGTPSFFINGQATPNPETIGAFTPLIQNALNATNDPFRLNRETGQITVRNSAALDFETTPSFTLTVNATGLNGAASTITSTINLLDVNETTPIAVADTYSVDANTSLNVSSSLGVLNNDTDGDGDSLTAQQVTPPTNGTISLNADGSFTYTPTTNFVGTDTFTYRATDGTLTSATATVTITVNTVNDAPLTAVDSYTLEEDGILTVSAANGVLVNDSDPEGSAITAVLVEAPEHGTVSLNADGSFTYTPEANFSATDTFTYAASDGQRSSGATTVTLLVQGVEDTPVGVSDSYNVLPGGVLNVTAANGLLANDTDADADTLTAVLLTSPTNGTLTLNGNGSFNYQPNNAFVGTDSFTYQASDGFFASDPVTVTIAVTSADLVRFRLEAVTNDGTPIDTITVGESFVVNGYVEDIRSAPQGVFAAYFDFTYDVSVINVNGPITYSAAFANGRSGSTTTQGLINEVGAFTQSSLGGGEALLFSVPFVATSAGTVDLTINPADVFPDHDTLLIGINTAIPIAQLDFVSDSVLVTSPASGEGEGSGLTEYAAYADEAFAAEDDWLQR